MTIAGKLTLSGGGQAYASLDNDGTLTGDSDERVATQKAAKTYMDAKVENPTAAELNGMFTHPGGMAVAYVDFNAAGEAAMTVIIDDVERLIKPEF